MTQYEIRDSRVFNSFLRIIRCINGSENAKTVSIPAPENSVGAKSGTDIPVSFLEQIVVSSLNTKATNP